MKEEETMEKKKTKEFLLFFNWRGILMYIPKYIERKKKCPFASLENCILLTGGSHLRAA